MASQYCIPIIWYSKTILRHTQIVSGYHTSNDMVFINLSVIWYFRTISESKWFSLTILAYAWEYFTAGCSQFNVRAVRCYTAGHTVLIRAVPCKAPCRKHERRKNMADSKST